MNKYPQCSTCWYNECINIDPEYNLEPPTKYLYEDQLGLYK